MRFSRPLLLALTCIASTAPLLGLEVYIPLTRGAGFDSAVGVTFEPSVSVRNFGGAPRAFSVSFIPAGTNGDRSRIPLGGQRLSPGAFAQVNDPEHSPGLIAISGAPQISVLGGLVVEGWTTDHVFASLTTFPAVRGDGGSKAGRPVQLSDALLRSGDGGTISDLGIVNLSRSPMRCSVDLGTISGGAGRVDPFEVSVPPISMAALQDVVGAHITGAPPSLAAASPQILCDQQYFAVGYIYLTDAQGNHSIKVSWPSVSLAP